MSLPIRPLPLSVPLTLLVAFCFAAEHPWHRTRALILRSMPTPTPAPRRSGCPPILVRPFIKALTMTLQLTSGSPSTTSTSA